jgi:hypothetical protein
MFDIQIPLPACRSIDGWKLFLRNAYWKNIREQLKEKFRAGSVASAALKTENFLSNAKKEDSTFNQYFNSSAFKLLAVFIQRMFYS